MTSLAHWPVVAASRVRMLRAVTPSWGVTP